MPRRAGQEMDATGDDRCGHINQAAPMLVLRQGDLEHAAPCGGEAEAGRRVAVGGEAPATKPAPVGRDSNERRRPPERANGVSKPLYSTRWTFVMLPGK